MTGHAIVLGYYLKDTKMDEEEIKSILAEALDDDINEDMLSDAMSSIES